MFLSRSISALVEALRHEVRLQNYAHSIHATVAFKAYHMFHEMRLQ